MASDPYDDLVADREHEFEFECFLRASEAPLTPEDRAELRHEYGLPAEAKPSAAEGKETTAGAD